MPLKVKFTVWYGPEADRKHKVRTEVFDDKILMDQWVEAMEKECKLKKLEYHKIIQETINLTKFD